MNRAVKATDNSTESVLDDVGLVIVQDGGRSSVVRTLMEIMDDCLGSLEPARENESRSEDNF